MVAIGICMQRVFYNNYQIIQTVGLYRLTTMNPNPNPKPNPNPNEVSFPLRQYLFTLHYTRVPNLLMVNENGVEFD